MTAHERLVGRDEELRLVDGLVAGPDGSGLLLRGEPGVGKTALLRVAAQRAEAAGMRVLRGAGVRFESAIGFSTLHQLLYPLRGHADRLAPDQRAALDRLLGRASENGASGTENQLVAAAAVLALLECAAAERPLFIALDDVRWVDPDSAAALAFAARRLSGAPVTLLAAGARSVFDQLRLPEFRLGPLADEPAAALLDDRYPGLAAGVRRRITAGAAGNPLALLELAGALSERQLTGNEPLPASPRLSARLEEAYGAGLDDLPEHTRRLLLLAALEPGANLALVRRAGDAGADDLAPAEAAGVLHRDPVRDRLVFRHPLVRAAVVQRTDPAQCRAAHRALADALVGDPSRRVRHLAEAEVAPDEKVAMELQEAARAAQRGGSASAALAAMVRASELSPEPTDRFRRLVEAASLASVAGPLERATGLLEQIQQARECPDGAVFTAAAVAVGLFQAQGDIDTGYRLLAEALDRAGDCVEVSSEWIDDTLHALMFVCEYGARPELWQLVEKAMDRYTPDGVTPLRLCYDAITDPARPPYPVRERIVAVIDGLACGTGSWQLTPLAFAALRVDALGDFRPAVRRAVDAERDGTAYGMVISGLLVLGVDSAYRGRWDEAEGLLTEGLEVARAHGYQLFEGQVRSHLAFLAAARGDVGESYALTDEIGAWAAARGVGMTQAFARKARTIAALGHGDFEEAFLQASLINPPGQPSPGIPGRWTVMDLVEAAVRTGRTEQAAEHVAAAQRIGIPRISPRTALITAGAAALAAPDERADALFRAALSLPEAERWPFEHARIQLAYGEWLRRTRDTGRARLRLRAALETLERIGARPWAQRARNELRATGVAAARPPAQRSAEPARLTFQESQIAELAATGLTNKQIGERLFLSHRTVSAHLRRVFPKLGISSRAALHDALHNSAELSG
ncbi:AAA family ATPase [Dactylosporangium sp. CA-092794]|uniref:helix-turn-helix transcriptional regulator n=1 Tax=Dactylosporangium sp. CA-092794 TaxID=3239929 RepID=UPI003D8B5AEF